MDRADKFTRSLHVLTVGGIAPLLLWGITIGVEAERDRCGLHVPLTVSCELSVPGGIASGINISIVFFLVLAVWPLIALSHRKWPLITGTAASGFAALSTIVFAETNAEHLPEDRWMLLTGSLVTVGIVLVAVATKHRTAAIGPAAFGLIASR